MIAIGIALLIVAAVCITSLGSGYSSKKFWNTFDWIGTVSFFVGMASLTVGVLVYTWRVLP